MDDHEAGNIGDLEKNSVLPVVEPKFNKDCPEAAVREGAEHFDTTNAGDNGDIR